MRRVVQKSAISAINRAGVLLVFPIDNRKKPASIWSHFFPRKKMRWEWDESGDNHVADLWQLRGDLSITRQVVYTKWYRGRATYFSRFVFLNMLRALNPENEPHGTLGADARRILEVLEGESPVSTKELKRMSDLSGRANERAYEKAMQELWSRLLIVAFGEVADGAFPSLAVGATRLLFEDLWTEAFRLDVSKAEHCMAEALPKDNLFYQYYLKLKMRKMRTDRARVITKQCAQQRRIPSVVSFEDL